MLGYAYKPDTKEYYYTVVIQEDPMNPGSYLMPPNCTLEEPITPSEGKAACFIDDAWVEVTDHRGGYQVNLETLDFTIVNYLGDAKIGYQFVTNEVYLDYMSDNEKYKVIDGVFTDISDTEEYQEILRKRELERIAKLHLTRGDVFRALLLARGVTRAQLRAIIEALPEETNEQSIAKEYALIDFDEALEFYRGVALIDQVGAQLGITPGNMTLFFETNDWHYLAPVVEEGDEEENE